MPDAKKSAREIFQQTLASIDIPRVMGSKLQFEGSRLIVAQTSVDTAKVNQFHIVAIGKAAHAMVDGLAAILPTSGPYSGVVAAPTTAQ